MRSRASARFAFPNAFETPRLYLRPIVLADAAAVFAAYSQDPEVSRFLTWMPHRNQASTEAYIRACIGESSSRTYAIVGRDDHALRGAFELRRSAPTAIGFGYALSRRWWGQGLMTEALAEVVDWGLRQDGIWRVGAFCDVENLASARVMEKAGLVREGVLRRWTVHPNLGSAPRDCFSYARVR